MKKTAFALLLIIFFFTSCISKKEYAALEAQNKETQDLLNTSEQKFYQILSEKENLSNENLELRLINEELKRRNEELIQNSTVVSSPYEMPAYAIYFQKLKPTKSIILNDYFKKGIPLLECNTKLTNILTKKLKVPNNNYKYFSINENSYAIITKKECITEQGVAINNQNCIPKNNCNMFQFFCVEEGYARFYLILVTTKTLGTPLDFDEDEFKKVYESDELDSNWNSIAEIEKLLKSNKKLTENYSIVIKLFEIKKDGSMGEAKLLANPTYEFEKEINNIFKSYTQ